MKKLKWMCAALIVIRSIEVIEAHSSYIHGEWIIEWFRVKFHKGIRQINGEFIKPLLRL